MILRTIGAVLLVGACGSFGFLMGAHYRREIQMLRQLLGALQEMECELKYRLTPLPELCIIAGWASRGKLRALFRCLGQTLECGACTEISGCMNGLLQTMDIPPRTGKCLKELGKSLGRFDLEGQLQGLQAVKGQCRKYLEEMESHRTERTRSYQTLGLCAGAALVILLV